MSEEIPDGDPRVELIEKAVEALSEHFDSIRIFATVHNPEGHDSDKTDAITKSYGNWYASFGLISEWLDRQHERNRINERGAD